MDEFDIPIFKKAYELYKEFYLCLRNFPRHEKFSLGQRCELAIAEIIESILGASQQTKAGKLPYLDKASVKLNILRIYIRLAKDIHALDSKKHLSIQELIDEIGRMLGGWRRSLYK